MKKLIAAMTVAAGVVALPVVANAEGNLAAPPATRLDLALTGAAATPSATTFDVETGKYYRLTITSDGGAEVLFMATDLFNNAWINQVVAGGVEIKMWGDSFKAIEVGEGGPMEVQITFVAVRPGDYSFYIIGDDDMAPPAGTFHVH